ncbi:ATP-dependent RNA helicase HrpA [Thermomonas carbonis]|uniref:ATP-dependent RNA helicase HrpA n=1 Tax=Thermomonas carbonis TaxID=1463158 RepID=A0A7G9SLS3_9GAMM|nr:ATP-dependent RNA helicase HrpA [Thermomonas carbonis]QNN68798.1 ATP-dependent RNA helicase HrpA [Thermomonas carbonis]GHC08684.1 ATP-dependent helicase [Thermomonas carbonis]
MASIQPDSKHASTPSPAQARRAIDGALSRDRGRLLGLWAKWNAKAADDALRQAFSAKLQASVAERERRAAALPAATVDASLPIAAHADDIVALIRKHQVVVLAGETGSGKTTQLPKICLLAGRGAAGMIGCTQPRRIAARSVARRVAEELQVQLGGAVGFQVRFNDAVGDTTAIKFMTDGILLAEIQTDRWLSKYDTIIVDEAHERSLNIDFLLGYLKQLLPKRPDLKLIVTSATIDTERFSAHFAGAPVVNVEGRGYPVEMRYRPLGEKPGSESTFSQDAVSPIPAKGKVDSDPGFSGHSMLDGIVAACDEIQRDKGIGDTLIFLPGEREIREAHRALEKRKYRHTEVLPLYARLSAKDQDRVFHPGSQRRIVLATNVAETSLTVPRIHYVVDPGVARVKRYSPRQKLDRLHIEAISQASANQRAGRCGRIAPGTCIRLYSEADFQSRAEFTDPEIRRAALAGVILRMLSLGLGDIEAFPFLEPPDSRAVADGWQQLNELGAVDAQRKLTAIGRTMSKLPVDVKLARMLVAATTHGVLREMIVIASFLGISDPRERPADARAAADAAHAQFADPKSEFVGILKLWQAYREAHEELTQSQLRKWADKQFLGFLRLREWWELHRQLKLQCQELGWETGEKPGSESTFPEKTHGSKVSERKVDSDPGFSSFAALHRALIAGLPTHLGNRGDRGLYDGPRGRKFQLFPGSNLASKPPPWVLSATLLDTEKVWSLTNAAIEPDWVIAELPHLLARRYHEPHWSRAQGRVLGSEQISLFGLVLAPKKPVHYGGLFPEESRVIFVREALLTGEINTRSPFLQRNLRTLEEAKQEEAKLRRVGLVVDEDWQARWYLDRLPPHVHNAQALDAWVAKLPKEQKGLLEWSRDDLLVVDQTDAALYPAYIALGTARLAVQYRFDPGAIDDGMTVAVPLHLLNALDDARLSWLAPGFVADKATALIKSLPKALRRNFVPAPDFGRAFAEAYSQPEADSIEGALARFLKKLSGVDVTALDFDAAGIDAHLLANLRVFDSDGKHVLAESRDVPELRTRFGRRAAEAFARHAAQGMAQAGLIDFPIQPVPLSVAGAGGVPAWPALQDDGDAASLAVHAQREVAERLHPQGVRRLLAIALSDKLKQARRQLPVPPKTSLLYAAIESASPRRDGLKDADRLRADLVDGAFAALAADGLLAIRDADAFAQRRDVVGKGVFAEAMRRLQQAEAILGLVAEVRAKLESKLIGWARANLDDLQAQLDGLVPPGFLRDVPADVLADYPRYLKAMSLRAERAQRDPVRDQQRMLELAPFVSALATADATHPEAVALRWDLEELRVQLFAQELGAKGGVSPKRLAARLERLQRTG